MTRARSAALTAVALFALSVPAANAAVIFGDGSGPSTNTARTPAAAASAKHHKSVKKHSTKKDVPPPVPPNFWQVVKNTRGGG